jgi:hypothetical protein
MKSEITIDSSSIFLTNSKKYIKIQLEIFSEAEDVTALGLLLFVNVLIHDVDSPIISDSARSILSKFPTWTALYEDSIEGATPSLKVPESVGGKFISSLVGEYLDNFESELNLQDINSFISTADEDVVDWIYMTYAVPSAALSVSGDGVELARSGSLESFYESRKTDYIYYHNLIDNQIITLRKFDNLSIDATTYDQDPILFFNIFDEFGSRVGLRRLYLENNSNYKKRILDVYQNPPSVDLDGLKLTLRRELDIWRAYGATPNSTYLGATPEILEMTDIESSTPYFTFDGNPSKDFNSFVRYINETYPSNLGYANWDEGIWDYAGLSGEGMLHIPFIYDTATPLGQYFQPGFGDFEDGKLLITSEDFATVSFEGYFQADGFMISSYKDHYNPIEIDFEYYADYILGVVPNPDASNPNSATPYNAGVSVVYEIHMPAHNQYATPSVFYTNMSYLDRDDFFVKNYYLQSSDASPEYNLIQVVNSDGLTNVNLPFREKTYNYPYVNTQATPNTNSIDVSKASEIRIVAKSKWNDSVDSYVTNSYAAYRIAFNEDGRGYWVNPTAGSYISLSTPNINYVNSNFKIGSTVYGTKNITGVTDTIEGKMVVNSFNDPSIVDDVLITKDEIKAPLIFPIGSTPQNIYFSSKKINPEPLYNTVQILSLKDPEHGGISYNYIDDSEYFVPASPNIVLDIYNEQFDSLEENIYSPVSSSYFETATINYTTGSETLVVTNGLASTPYYPFKSPIWTQLTQPLSSTPMIQGYLDRYGNAYKDGEIIEDSGRTTNPGQVDSFVTRCSLSRQSFGLGPEDNETYVITSIDAVSLNEDINLVVPNRQVSSSGFSPDSAVNFIQETYNVDTGTYEYGELTVNAYAADYYDNKNISLLDTKQPDINVGWLDLPNSEYYIYSAPVIEAYSGQFFELQLNDIPRQGAPVIVNVYSGDSTIQYDELVFSDAATPGNVTFYNEETVIGSDDLALYLAYPNISNLTLQDTYSGNILVQSSLNPEFYIWTSVDQSGNYILDEDEDTEYYIFNSDFIQSGDQLYTLVGNRFAILNSETYESRIIPGREYLVTYTVNNSYYIDRNYYDSSSDDYFGKIYFASTPKITSLYEVTYETSRYKSSTPSGLYLNPLYNPIDEGFVFVSDSDYDFDTAGVWISPQKIFDVSDDIIYISIVSYDTNGNPKPYQTFRVYGNEITAENEYVTTNQNGFATTSFRYSGVNPAVKTTIEIFVSGISYPAANAHNNSSSGSFSDSYTVDLALSNTYTYEFKAAPDKMNIKADGLGDIYIKGYVRQGNVPSASAPAIYWRKARTAYSALEQTNYLANSSTPGRYGTSGFVYADQYGNFNIGPFYAQDRTKPGYWFVALDTELASTPSATPVTIYGDIVYWYENYDNLHYSNEIVPLPGSYTAIPTSGSEIIADSSFTYRHYDMEFDNQSAATINWLPPRWFPISRYEQYQMGFFGSTPNTISEYQNLNADYEDS